MTIDLILGLTERQVVTILMWVVLGGTLLFVLVYMFYEWRSGG